MVKALARRNDDLQQLQQFSVDELESLDVYGPDNMPVWGERRDFAWFVRDGFYVRSPLKVNGVTLSAGQRRKAEDEYLKRAHDRASSRGAAAAQEAAVPTDVDGLVRQSRQPALMRSATFLQFKFEDHYSLVGHETVEGLDVLRIECYPERLLSRQAGRGLLPPRGGGDGHQEREKQKDAAIATMLNKSSLITIWVEPKSQQIVQYMFNNVSLDFLPAAELIRVRNLRATMTMSRPLAGAADIWLPRGADFFFDGMVASGSIEARYRVEYSNYRRGQPPTGTGRQ